MNHTATDIKMVDEQFESTISPAGGIISGIYIACIIVISCIGNGAVLVISMRKRKNLKPLDLLTINLAVADLAVSVIGYPLPSASGFANRWLFGKYGCIWYGFCGFFFSVTAMVTLTVMAVFRYLKLCRRNFGDSLFARHMPKVIAATWVYSLVWTVPPLFGWNRYVPERFHTSCAVDWASRRSLDQSYVICVLIFCYLLQLVVLVVCYGAIARTMFTHRKMILKHNAAQSFKHYLSENRMVKSSFAVTAAYMIAWTPYAIVCFWAFAADASTFPNIATALPVFLAKSAAVYNPIIYTILNQKFKKELQVLCCCCACKCYTISINTSNHPKPEIVSNLTGVINHGERLRITWSNPFTRFLVPKSALAPNVNRRRSGPLEKKCFRISKKPGIPINLDNPLGMIIQEPDAEPVGIVNPFAYLPEEDIPGPSTSQMVNRFPPYPVPVIHLPNVPSTSPVEAMGTFLKAPSTETFSIDRTSTIMSTQAKLEHRNQYE